MGPASGDERVSDYAGLTIALVCQSVPKRTSATATFRVLAKGDLDADAPLASAVGAGRRRGR